MSDSEESLPNLFDDDTDEDATYNPNTEETDSSESDAMDAETGEVEEPEHEEPPSKRPKHPGKKKTRRPHLWKINQRSKARNEGQKYTDRKGKVHEARKVVEFNHNCRFKCNEKINEEKRKQVFDEYWKLGDWELQSSFSSSSVVLENPERKEQAANRARSVSCQFFLTKFLCTNRVCKEFFLKTLDVTNKRITNVINKKKVSNTGISPRDQRGQKIPANKTPNDKLKLVREHITKFPRYSSHYSRSQAPNKRYLDPHLNIKKLYKLYRAYLKEKGLLPESVSPSLYRHVFNTQFNLSFKRPKTDTCNTCDKLQSVIDHGAPGERNSAITQKELHLRKAEKAKTEMEKAREKSKIDETQVSICFDLQKMLPTPVLTCSRVYYSRQLWTYNLCVHDMGKESACMFLWHEGQASRGCEEIMSCLLKYINTLPPTVTHLTAFSDNCGGQNKSQFVVKFWLYIVNHTNIQTIDHKFLQCGHSYNDCDRDFGLVEKAKKKHEKGMFVPDDWAEVIAQGARKFLVIKMEDNDFITLDEIQRFFVKSVVGIRKMQWLQYRKNEPWKLFFKDTFNEDLPFSTYNMKAKGVTGRIPETLPELTSKTDRKKIKKAKYNDLLGLLEFIPPVHHEFYRTLAVEGQPNSTTQTRSRSSQGSGAEAASTSSAQYEDNDTDLDNIYDSDDSE